MAIGATIKTIQDIMRKDNGVDGDAQRIGQLVWMLFLKVLDDREIEKETSAKKGSKYRSPIPDELRWGSWAGDAEGITGEELLTFINGTLFPQLKELPGTDPVVGVIRSVFEGAYNFMKNGTLLRQVANKLNEIDLNRSQDRHEIGGIYEQILSDLRAAGNAGEFYTPRGVTAFMVAQVAPQLGEIVLDPACGTGGFLACTIDYLRKNGDGSAADEKKIQSAIRGIEKKSLPHLLCVTNMVLHGIDAPTQVRHTNSLGKAISEYGKKDLVDVILTNPPFGGVEEDGIEDNFPSFRTKETADLFLVLILTILRDGGRAALVLPDGTLFGDGIKARLKERLLEECNLHTIVRLPKGVFGPYTGIKTNLLFFTKGESTKEVWFYEHPYPPGYKSYSKTKPLRLEEFQPEQAWWDNRVENDFAWRVDMETIRANGFNLDSKNPRATGEINGDAEEMLLAYRKLTGEVAEVRDKLRDELRAALEGAAR
jgi:type I restriction enzyme M protein